MRSMVATSSLLLSPRLLLVALLAFVLSFSIVAHAAPSGLDGGENMVDLTGANFKDDTAHGMRLIEFYSPACGHCRKFAPTFKSVAEIQEHWSEYNFKIRRVNCLVSGDLCEAQKITGYPSLHLYKDGELVERYKGDRSFDDLMRFITARASDYRKETIGDGKGKGVAARSPRRVVWARDW